MSYIKAVCMAILVLYIGGCGRPPINLSLMKPMSGDSVVLNIPDSCQYLYEHKKWSIAVLEFANNTGYGNMTLKNTDTAGNIHTKSTAVGAGVVANNHHGNKYGTFAAVGVSNTNYSNNRAEFMGQFAPSLGAFAQSVVENALVSVGGVNVYNRSYMDKIMQEHKFQMSIADPDSVVEFGNLSGVRYIITGSVDNINAKYVRPTEVENNGSDFGSILSAVSAGYDAFISGWFVTAKITIELIDTETGKIIYSDTMDSKRRATQSKNFQADIIINTAKSIITEDMHQFRENAAKVFAVTGYVNELRGGKQIAQINIGSKDGIRKGDVLDVLSVNVSKDFRTNQVKCELINTGISIEISEQISDESAWGYVEGKKDNLENIMIGSIVRRSELGH